MGRIAQSLQDAFGRIVGFIPNLVAALLVLVVGIAIAVFLGNVTERLLGRSRFDGFVSRQRFAGALRGRSGSMLVAKVVFWAVALVTFLIAADTLQLGWLSAGLAAVLGYLPNVIAAVFVAIVGYLVATWAARRVTQDGRIRPASGRLVQGVVYLFAAFMAIQQLRIATAIVNMAFGFLLGSIAVAAAIAFGLGNRELAARITQEWYTQQRDALRADGSPARPPERGAEA